MTLVGPRQLDKTGEEGTTHWALATDNDRMQKGDSQIGKIRPNPFHAGTKASFNALELSLLEILETFIDIMNGVHTVRKPVVPPL